VDKLQIKHILIGDDFRFGHQREGDRALLMKLGERFGFTTEAMHSIMGDGERVSSTQVRAALKAGDCEGASRLLGRPYTMIGVVVHGDERGRLLGYPTANLEPGRKVLPLKGVFAVKVHGLGSVYEGMANVGTRPTVDGLKTLIEVNLFAFNDTIYDKRIEIEFCNKVRDEQTFSSIDALKAQLALDKTQVKAYFTHG
jgi:riboflavin kinase/FMN adenylyltransferase